MDEDSAKSVKVRAPRHGHKHKSKKSPPMSPEATLRIISRDALDDCDKENPAQLLEQLRKFPDDDPPDRDDSKLDPREAHDADSELLTNIEATLFFNHTVVQLFISSAVFLYESVYNSQEII